VTLILRAFNWRVWLPIFCHNLQCTDVVFWLFCIIMFCVEHIFVFKVLKQNLLQITECCFLGYNGHRSVFKQMQIYAEWNTNFGLENCRKFYSYFVLHPLKSDRCHITRLPYHNNDLPTMASFLRPQGGHCRKALLYFIYILFIFYWDILASIWIIPFKAKSWEPRTHQELCHQS